MHIYFTWSVTYILFSIPFPFLLFSLSFFHPFLLSFISSLFTSSLLFKFCLHSFILHFSSFYSHPFPHSLHPPSFHHFFPSFPLSSFFPSFFSLHSRKLGHGLVVAPDRKGQARGQLYWDDGDSLGESHYFSFSWLFFYASVTDISVSRSCLLKISSCCIYSNTLLS